MSGHTPGPWRVIEREIPWSLESGRKGSHIERWIYTEWEHPQLKGPVPVATLSTGIGLAMAPPIRMVSIREHDARLIAAAPELMDAICALGVIGAGYCFCSHDRDPDKTEHQPECSDARAAIAKATAA